ncbi:hypothetical protein PAAG_11033 [Paracoccidioides lutzii Pb01]|uniref:Uncharacterized protein n=1 Tax=Paracoccidioides lutzii (strain ATCC MYA-826 / Pb01) TaxID=502779 RepID=A0A0A2VML9_PARBA|nr:hypothetical protein PAAG_11033 [Paracoccidioides lutzii Pb01]KGQ02084.1 hypothetical protein PAAG_11033 [Paracoccidioides lutzii Pb01]
MNMIQQLFKIFIIKSIEESNTKPSTEKLNTRSSTETSIIEASIIKALSINEASTRPSAENFCEKLYQQLFEFNLKVHDDLVHE